MARPTKQDLIDRLLENSSMTKEQLERMGWDDLNELAKELPADEPEEEPTEDSDTEEDSEDTDTQDEGGEQEEDEGSEADEPEEEPETAGNRLIVVKNVNHNNVTYNVGDDITGTPIARLFTKQGFAEYK